MDIAESYTNRTSTGRSSAKLVCDLDYRRQIVRDMKYKGGIERKLWRSRNTQTWKEVREDIWDKLSHIVEVSLLVSSKEILSPAIRLILASGGQIYYHPKCLVSGEW